MTLAPGSRLGPYEITSAIGAGGMGEVFRARDTRLDRDVAIKVLPAQFAQERERLARFEREAKLLASLNHPNIAAIYGIEDVGAPLVGALDEGRESAGTRPAPAPTVALVMELVEGEDLAERLRRGELPTDEAIAIARQIAEGLEEAHEHGIIHRDLKPANVRLTHDGKVKILDFGLAKAMEGDAGNSAARSQLSHSPTVSRMTEAGVIMGTAAYMSPEQARGKAVDKRADVWAFGVVLFEMLSGARLFTGETATDVLAAVVRQEFDWSKLPAAVPTPVVAMLKRCLERDAQTRLRDIGEARVALSRADDPMDESAQSGRPVEAERSRLARWWPYAAVVVALAGWATAGLLGTRPRETAVDLRATLSFPESVTIPVNVYNDVGSLATVVISPQGDQVAFSGIKDAQGALYLRRLDQFEASRLPNTEDASAPFFSADGNHLAFFARERLWRIDLPDGLPVAVGPGSNESVGASWGDDGRIVFTPSWSDALFTISDQGGEPRPLTILDRDAGEVSHRWPCVLPGSAWVLFTIKSSSTKTMDEATIAIADSKTGAHRILIKGGSRPRYLDRGELLFSRDGRLFAIPFDRRSGTIIGSPTPVLDGVTASSSTGNAWYDVSRAGHLVYLAGGKTNLQTRLVLEGPGRSPSFFGSLDTDWVGYPFLSSDATRLVVGIGGANDKLGLVDLERKNLTRLTSGGGNDGEGALSRDGRFLLFSSDREGGRYRLYRVPLDGSLPPAPAFDLGIRVHSISYAAGMLGVDVDAGPDAADAYLLPVSPDGTVAGKPVLVAGGPGYQGRPMVSPDGKLVAWTSTESGRHEVYVARLGDPGGRRRLTNAGGKEPHWNRQGTRLFYLASRGIMSVPLRSAIELSFGDPQAVTQSVGADRIFGYDVAADGTSVLYGRLEEPEGPPRELRIWPGWGETLKTIR